MRLPVTLPILKKVDSGCAHHDYVYLYIYYDNCHDVIGFPGFLLSGRNGISSGGVFAIVLAVRGHVHAGRNNKCIISSF